MALAGPRLDRPSAVGDEGRPRATSLTIAAAVVVGLFLAAAARLSGELGPLVGSGGPFQPVVLVSQVALPAGLTVTGVALLGRERVATRVVGHLVFLFGGSLLVALAAAAVVVPAGPLLGGFLLACLGVGLTWTDTARADAVSRATVRGAASYFATLFGLAGLLLLASLLATGVALLERTVATSDPGTALAGFGGVLAALGLSTLLALHWLPLLQWAPPATRQSVWRGRWWARRTAAALTVLGLATLVAGPVLAAPLDRVVATTPAVAALIEVLSAPVVLLPLLALAGLALLAAVGVRVLDAVVDRSGAPLDTALAAGTAGGLLAVVVAPVFLGAGGSIVALVVVAPLGLLALGAAFVGAVRLGLLPDRAAGPALGAVGLLVAAAGAGQAGQSGVIVFGLATGALVVWDVSAFGLGLTAELGHQPETRRLELYHGALSVGVGVVAVGALTGLDWLVRTVSAGGAVVAAAVAVVGVAVLTLPLAR